MAYADYNFYAQGFCGDVLTEANAAKWLMRASDALDSITFGRLIEAFPTVPIHVEKVKKAVCAVAETLFYIDEYRAAVQVKQSADGSYHGPVSAISSGKESITYAVNSTASIYASAAADERVRDRLLFSAAVAYLANVPDANGVNLLYAGGN